MNVSKKKRLVVFDVAGTTVQDDDVVADAFLMAFKNVNGVAPERKEVDRVMGMSKRVAICQLLNRSADDFVVDKIHDEFLKEMIKSYREKGVKEISGASETFLKLKNAGFLVALNTGFPRIVLDAVLHATQWVGNGFIDDSIASDEVSEGRPAPYMIFRLMERLRISHVSAVTKVGDTLVEAIVKNSHNGMATLNISAGLHRLVCANG